MPERLENDYDCTAARDTGGFKILKFLPLNM